MTLLSIYLLGAFSVQCAGTEVKEVYYDRMRALLAYLLVENKFPVRREKMAALLWPDLSDNAARANLRLAVFRLNHAFIGGSVTVCSGKEKIISTTKTTLQINQSFGLVVDAIRLSDCIDQITRHHPDRLILCQECIELLQEAVNLYQGEFLSGLNINSSSFLEWLDNRRDTYRHIVVGAFYLLIMHFSRIHKYSWVLQLTEKLLSIEPWAEDVHRYQMYVLCLVGQHQSAIRHFEKCKKNLADSVNVSPSMDTIHLYDSILRIRKNQTRFSNNPMEGIPSVTLIPPD